MESWKGGKTYGRTEGGKYYTQEILSFSSRDLLSKDGEKLDIKINPDGTGQLHVPGLRIKEVKNFQHIKKVSLALEFQSYTKSCKSFGKCEGHISGLSW